MPESNTTHSLILLPLQRLDGVQESRLILNLNLAPLGPLVLLLEDKGEQGEDAQGAKVEADSGPQSGDVAGSVGLTVHG